VWFLLAGLAAVAAAVGAWRLGHEPRGGFDPAAYRLRRLTYDNGLAYQSALSADGKLVVYASDRAGKGNLDIWLQQTTGGEPIPLTSDSADEFEPSISPDGAQVVFRSTRDRGGIYVVPTLGGTPRLLASPGYRPRFSPDGKRVAYWLGQEHVPGGTERSKIFVVPVEGGEAVQVGSGRSPVWSPDGNQLLYLRTTSYLGFPEWVLSTLDGKEPSPTTAMEVLRESSLAGDPVILLPPVFVPEQWLDDGRVLFSAGSGQAYNIWSIHIAPRTGRVSGPPQRITTGSGEHRFASGTNDGRLAFADVRENRDIWILPTDTNRGEASGEIRREASNAAVDEEPSLSPDGSTLAFRSNRSGAMDVWIKNLTTGQTKPLTATEMDEGAIIVKADREFVAFSTRVRPMVGAGHLTYAARIADGDLRKLCEDCGLISDWSPSGRLLIGYIESAATRALGLSGGVTLTDTNTGRSRVLFRQNQPEWRFSPDERWLAFHNSTQSGRGIRQVFIAPLPEEGEIDESDLIPVTDGSDNSFLPGWSPDGNLIYYGSSRDGNTCIFAQPLDQETKHPAGPVREVYHAHSARISLTGIRNPGRIGLSVAKDKIAFAMTEITSDIWIMEPRDAE
jgi:Tol biopolymer transport system component